jgi:glutamyl-Q tRNA(Asp) synthetase
VRYVGRFAPSPTGDLHLGSLYTAVASYVDARASRGRWLLRIEDLDPPREVPGAAQRIVDTLAAFGFEWDGPIRRQSERTAAYEAALAHLRSQRVLYECSCSRATLTGPYPGLCRGGARIPGVPTSLRLRIEPGEVHFNDRLQGEQHEDLSRSTGDLIVRRRDGWYAYALAVVVDDADQGITDVVRGADLLEHTAAQIHLQGVLSLPSPRYAHVPALTEPGGAKLAKSARSVPLDPSAAPGLLVQTLRLLGLDPPGELAREAPAAVLSWAIEHFSWKAIPRELTISIR